MAPVAVAIAAAVTKAAVIKFVAVVALSLALGAYQQSRARSKQRAAEQAARDAYNASLKDRTITIRSGVSTRKYVLGRVRVGGTLMHIEANGWENTALDSVLALACNRCELDGYYLGDEFVSVSDFPGEKYGNKKEIDHRTRLWSGMIPPVAPGEALRVELVGPPIGGEIRFSSPLPAGVTWELDESTLILRGVAEAESGFGAFPGVTYKTLGATKIRMIYQNGDPNQTAAGWGDTETPLWGDDHRLRGVAYLRMLNLWDEDVYHSGAPQIGAVLKGGPVDGHAFYDPRTGEHREHTTNPALLSAWYMTLPRRLGGMGIPESWINWPYVAVAANICDEQIRVRTLDGTGYEYINRYVCNTVIDTGNPPVENLNMILSSMAGDRVFTAGQYRIFAGAFRSATVTLTDDDVAGDKDITMDKSGQDDAPANIVTATFVNEHRNWLESSPRAIRNEAYIQADGAESPLDLSLPATTDERHVAYLMGVALESARPAFAGKLTVLGVGEDLAVMDTVRLDLSNRPQYSGRTFQIINRIDNWDGTFELTLQETRANVWSLDPDTFLPTDPTPVPDTSYLWNVAPVTGLVIDAQKPQALADGTAVVRVDLAWDEHPQPYVRQGGRIEVRYRALDGDWIWLPAVDGAETGTSFTAALVHDMSYQFQARAVNGVGAASNWTDGWDEYDGVIEAPPALTGLSVSGVVAGMDVSWTFPGARNAIRHTEIRYAAADDLNESAVLGQYAWPTNRMSLLGLAYNAQLWFWGRLVDENGTAGPWYPDGGGIHGMANTDPSAILDLIGEDLGQTPWGQEMLRRAEGVDIRLLGVRAEIGNADEVIQKTRDQVQRNVRDIRTHAGDLLAQAGQISKNIDDIAAEALQRHAGDQAQASALTAESSARLAAQQQHAGLIAANAADILQEAVERLAEVGALRDTTSQRIATVEATVADIVGTEAYSPLQPYLDASLVTHNGKLYRAKQYVPAGVSPPNITYWELLGDYASLGAAVGDLSSRMVSVELLSEDNAERIGVVGTQAGNTASQVETLTGTVADQATVSAGLRTDVDGNTARVNLLQQTADGIAVDQAALGVRVDGVASDVLSVSQAQAGLAQDLVDVSARTAGVENTAQSLLQADLDQALSLVRLKAEQGNADATFTQIIKANGRTLRMLTAMGLRVDGVVVDYGRLIELTGEMGVIQETLGFELNGVKSNVAAVTAVQEGHTSQLLDMRADVNGVTATAATLTQATGQLAAQQTALGIRVGDTESDLQSTQQAQAGIVQDVSDLTVRTGDAEQQLVTAAQVLVDHTSLLAGLRSDVNGNTASVDVLQQTADGIAVDQAAIKVRVEGVESTALTLTQGQAGLVQDMAALGVRTTDVENTAQSLLQADLDQALSLVRLKAEQGNADATFTQIIKANGRTLRMLTAMGLRVDGVTVNYEQLIELTGNQGSLLSALGLEVTGIKADVVTLDTVQKGHAQQITNVSAAASAAQGTANGALADAAAAQSAAVQNAADIVTANQARADGDSALSQSVGSLSATVSVIDGKVVAAQQAADAANAGVLTVNARADAEEVTRAAADAALAQRSTNLEATTSTHGTQIETLDRATLDHALRQLNMRAESGNSDSYMTQQTRLVAYQGRQIVQLVSQTGDLQASIQQVRETLTDETGALSQQITIVAASAQAAGTAAATAQVDADAAQATGSAAASAAAAAMAAVQQEETARISAVLSVAQSVQTVQTSLDGVSATVQDNSQAIIDLNGNIAAWKTVKVQTNVNGVDYIAGTSLGIDGTGQSSFNVLANAFNVLQTVDGVLRPFFSVSNGALIVNTALIDQLHGNKILANTVNADRITTDSFNAKLVSTDVVFVREGNIENLTITRLKLAYGAINTTHIFDYPAGNIREYYGFGNNLLSTYFHVPEGVETIELGVMIDVEYADFQTGQGHPIEVITAIAGNELDRRQVTARRVGTSYTTHHNLRRYDLQLWRFSLPAGTHHLNVWVDVGNSLFLNVIYSAFIRATHR